jgi:hypothetical protein
MRPEEMFRRGAELLLSLAIGCAASPSPTETCVRALKEGMSIEAIDQALAPVLVAKAFTYGMGSGAHSIFYRLKGDVELTIRTGASPDDERADWIRPLRPKKRWFGIFFDPAPEDRSRAFEIAVNRVKASLRTGESVPKAFPTDPGGRLVSGHSFRVDLELQPGMPENVEVSCGMATWRTHRLLSMDFLKAGSWLFEITVDLDDGKVVPTQWTPTDEEIARARALSDAQLSKFLKKEGKLEVRAYGEYDYGPLRRIVYLSYEIHEPGNGTALNGSMIDLDAGKPFDWPD